MNVGSLHGVGERLLAVHNGLTAVARPSDELLQEGVDLLDESKDGFKGL